MDGIILFADNKVFCDGPENKLFKLFLQKQEFPILPIDNLSCLKTVLRSASTFKACIIDWNFENMVYDDDDFQDVQHPQRTPMSLLQDYSLYTLVYIYSEQPISAIDKSILKKKFGKKIHFRIKGNKIDREYKSITNDIKKFEKANPHMKIPFLWSQTINSTTQSLFDELEHVNQNWITEFRDSISTDGGDPTSELIEIFNNVLCEAIIQSPTLRHSLDSYDVETKSKSEKATARVYQRLIYSKIPKEAPIMTGEIFRFKKDQYGILITPECEIKERQDNQMAFLVFNRCDFKFYLDKNKSYNKDNNFDCLKENRKNSLRKVFNNDNLSTQILPVFPFTSNRFNEVACIDFKTAFCIKKKKEYENKRLMYKLNSPFIHQLRQRYVSFFGKFGVPAIPISLRDYNLK